MKLTFKLADSCPRMSARGAFSQGPVTVSGPFYQTAHPRLPANPLLRRRCDRASSSDPPPPSTSGRRSDAGSAVAAESPRPDQSRSERSSGVAGKVKGRILKRTRRRLGSSGLRGRVRIEDLALPLGMSVAAVIGQAYIYSSNLGYIC